MIHALAALLFVSSALPLHVSSLVFHYTSSGGVCTGACGYHGYDYTWCEQSGGNGKKWDYCSLHSGLQATGLPCATPCITWGGSYHYCYLVTGAWHYCGLIGKRDLLQFSEENNFCINSCRANNSSFQCNTVKGVERCSPFSDVTPMGLPCHTHYRCARYGNSLYRCHTDEIHVLWDQCGRRSLDRCVWFVNTSDVENFLVSPKEFCVLSNYQKGGQIILRREKQKPMYDYFPSKEFRNAVHLIDAIDSITNLPDSGYVGRAYLSKQESVFCKGINYTNVELKIAITNTTSVSVAHVVFPEILESVEILRFAFYTSLHSHYFLPAYSIVMSVGEAMLCCIEPMEYLTGQ